jgi:hypothetical protein
VFLIFSLPVASMSSMDDIQALIDGTEALGWGSPVQLETHVGDPACREGYVFIGKLLAPRPFNTHNVRQALTSSWSFAVPFTIEILASNKFLFTVQNEAVFKRIIHQGPWNIRNCLLVLCPWSPSLAIDEVKLDFCPFWVQVHNLPHQHMTVKNAVGIGKGIGDFLELDNVFSGSLICRQYIRFRINVNTSKPLASGFYLDRPNMAPHWIAFKYERLDDYCVLCGLIGHKRGQCPAPQILDPPSKYDISLRPETASGPRLVAAVQSEDSDSGLSSAASVGNSPSSIGPSHASSSSSKNLAQLIPHVSSGLHQFNAHAAFSQALVEPHVDAPHMILDLSDIPQAPAHQEHMVASPLGPKCATSHHKWKQATQPQAICQLRDKLKVSNIYSKSADPSPQHTIINDPTSFPLLSTYSHQNIPQQSPFSQDSTNPFTPPVFESSQDSANYFNTFLSSWALIHNNPNLFGPPPPFQKSLYPTTAHPTFQQPFMGHSLHSTPFSSKSHVSHNPQSGPAPTQPITTPAINPYTSNITHSHRTHFHTHKPSRFMPYSHDWKPNAVAGHKSHSSTLALELSLSSVSSLASSSPSVPAPVSTSPALLQPTLSPPPEMQLLEDSVSVLGGSSPSLVSHTRGKGKMKWFHDEDDIPLAQLKRSRRADSGSLDSLSPIEVAAYSLTQLQHAPPEFGPMFNFLNKPLLDFQGRVTGVMPQPLSFATDPTATPTLELSPPFIPADNSSIASPTVAGLSRTKTRSTVSSVSTVVSAASVAANSGTTRRSPRSTRGRRRGSSRGAVASLTPSLAADPATTDFKEEGLAGPPPVI